ncbi:MAG TPA: dihydrolipoamide acetyltransferase family protein [Anaerolineae bacterium]|nr:dihydrolipoamide acetyltransferase family protein [Anaerolineae bacterium]
MATKVTMPQMGFDMTEGKVARWLKKVGEAVKQGEPVAEIETDKVNIETEAVGNGVLREIIASEGSTVPVGTLIAIIAEPDEDISALIAESGKGSATAPKATVVQEAAAVSTPALASTSTVPMVDPSATHVASKGNGRLKASPLAKRVARERGVNISDVTGTGPGGRIVKRDVDSAVSMPIAAPSALRVAAPAMLGPSLLKDELVAPSKLRQTIARRMTASKQTVPHFYVTIEVEMSEALALRSKLNAIVGDDGKISVNDMVIKAAALALTHFPSINASYTDSGIQRHGSVNIGIAVALDQGLITVVVNEADRKPLVQIAREARDIATRAKNGKARPEEMQGSTFTVSNLGMFGEVDSFTAIINPPEAAILAVGTMRDVPIVRDGQIVPGKTLKMTIAADHRVTDGAEAAKFMQVLKQNLEEPLRLLV